MVKQSPYKALTAGSTPAPTITLKKTMKNFNLPKNILFSLGGIQMKESLKVRGILKNNKLFNKDVLEVHPHFYNRVNYAVAYVVDDPMAAFKVAVTDGSSVMSSAARAAIGSNMSVVQGTGSATSGDSAQSVLAGSEATTAALPIRVIDVVPATATGTDTFVELVVKINLHQYNNTTGV